MKRQWLHTVFLGLAILSVENCKKDAVMRRPLIQDLPAGYVLEEPEVKSYREKATAVDSDGSVAYFDDAAFTASERVAGGLKESGLKKNDEEMTTVEGDVRLRLWKSQPRVFVHLEDEVETPKKRK